MTHQESLEKNADGARQRAYWVGLMHRIAGPVLETSARRELKRCMRFEITPANRNAGREPFSHLEAVARVLVGIAPWLDLQPAGLPAHESQLASLYHGYARAALTSIADRSSPDYGGFAHGTQPLVEAAFLAQAILRAPVTLWRKLSPIARQNIVTALRETRQVRPTAGNWLLFSAMVEFFLACFGGRDDWDRERIEGALRKHEDYYKGDGAYGDGPEFHWDYYNGFVIQPMLLDLIDGISKHGLKIGSADARRIRSRAQRYAAVQERFISPEGAFPPMGRSLAYRVGALQSLAQMALRRDLPPQLNAAQVREALTAAIRGSLEAPGTFDDQGWLRIGFCGSQPSLGEHYITTGSCYLCSAVFLPLGLPPADPFWTLHSAAWTAKKIYAGLDVPADHAWSESDISGPMFAAPPTPAR